MKMNDEVIKKINEGVKYCDLNVQDSISGVTIYDKNWAICDLKNLSTMIDDLSRMRDWIEEVIGVRF